MKNYTKVKLFTLIFCVFVILITLFIQLSGQDMVKFRCSYLDPVTIDFLAFGVGIFLFFEGIYRISEHKNMGMKRQFTRIIRVGIGCAIITLHVLQFLHK